MGNLFVKIAEFNPVNATQLEIAGTYFSGSGFETFFVRMYNIRPTVDDSNIFIEARDQAAGNYRGSTEYGLVGPRIPSTSNISFSRSSSTGVALGINLQRDTGRSPVTLEAYLFGMRTTYVNTVVASRTIGGNYLNQSNWTSHVAAGTFKSKSLKNGVRIRFHRGNIASGRIVLFGVAHTDQGSADDAWKFISTRDSGGFVTTFRVGTPDFSDTYHIYRIIFHRLRNSRSGVGSAKMQLRDESSGLYDDSGYGFNRSLIYSTGQIFEAGNNNASALPLGRYAANSTDYSGSVSGGDLIITGMRNSGVLSSFSGIMVQNTKSSILNDITATATMFVSGASNDSSLKNGIRFNQTDGRVDIRMSLFGLKEAA